MESSNLYPEATSDSKAEQGHSDKTDWGSGPSEEKTIRCLRRYEKEVERWKSWYPKSQGKKGRGLS